ncbi:MAG: hypothetical protein OXT67_00070 [Zetaproteobacteria bacterium]|nr:hypothetical protein [Zetaproteobacteria bacterium]
MTRRKKRPLLCQITLVLAFSYPFYSLLGSTTAFTVPATELIGRKVRVEQLLGKLHPKWQQPQQTAAAGTTASPRGQKAIPSSTQEAMQQVWTKSLAAFTEATPIQVAKWLQEPINPTEAIETTTGPLTDSLQRAQVSNPAVSFEELVTEDTAPAATTSYTIVSKQGMIEPPTEPVSGSIGTRIPFHFQLEDSSEVEVFSFDDQHVTWSAETHSLELHAPGNTEIFLHYRKQLVRIPISIQGSTESLATVPQRTHSTSQNTPVRALDLYATTDMTHTLFADVGEHEKVAALKPSRLDINNGGAQLTTHSRKPMAEFKLNIQDERSLITGKRLYPLEGIHAKAVGIGYLGTSDAQGNISLAHLPQYSRMLITLYDEGGEYVTAVQEIHLDDPTQALQNIYMARQSALELAATANHMQLGGPDGSTASLCGRVLDTRDQTVPNAQLHLWNTQTEGLSGPHYFSAEGLPDTALKATSSNGRFCYFGVSPGPVSIEVLYNQHSENIIVSTFPGIHRELPIALSTAKPMQLSPTISPRFQTLAHNDPTKARSNHPAKGVSLTATHSLQAMHKHKVGKREVHHSARGAKTEGTTCAMLDPLIPANTAFFPTLYCPRIAHESVPLFPNGFFHAFGWEGQVEFGSDSFHVSDEGGIAYVQYAASSPDTDQTIELWQLGAEEPLTYSKVAFTTGDITHTGFFNLPSDMYQVVVRSSTGDILDATTIPVYTATASYARLGKLLQLSSP